MQLLYFFVLHFQCAQRAEKKASLAYSVVENFKIDRDQGKFDFRIKTERDERNFFWHFFFAEVRRFVFAQPKDWITNKLFSN